jgi:hypothetical protein
VGSDAVVWKVASNRIGARSVVAITIRTIPASIDSGSASVAEPKPTKTSPTSPRGTIPMLIATRLRGDELDTKKPAVTLPTIATTIRKTAIIRPSRFAGWLD